MACTYVTLQRQLTIARINPTGFKERVLGVVNNVVTNMERFLLSLRDCRRVGAGGEISQRG